MFDAILEAGLKPRHVAKILDISRVTASQWLNNHTKPHPLLRSKVKLLIESVDKAIVDKQLPAPLHYRGKQESNYICETVQRYMASTTTH